MKKIAIVVLSLSFIVASNAQADNSGKAYIAGDVGRAIFVPATIYDNPGMFRIAAGYHYNSSFAAEIGYTKFADTAVVLSSGTLTLAVASLQVAGVASYPLSADFDLTAKLGISNNTLNAKATGNVTLIKSTYSVFSLMYGVGAQYHVNSNVSVRAQYEDYGAIDDSSPTVKMTALSAGVVYNF